MAASNQHCGQWLFFMANWYIRRNKKNENGAIKQDESESETFYIKFWYSCSYL